MRPTAIPWVLVLVLLALRPLAGRAEEDEPEEEADPPEVAVGERLFLETRFSQYFFAHAGGDPNAVLPAGDPVVATLDTPAGPIPGPFAGQAMSCRSCHLVDDAKDTPGGGNRAYADFARRSPIPGRDDGGTTAPRNSPALVNALRPRDRLPLVLHFDGEFPSAAALARGTYTGRNFGWLPAERDMAVAHIARVIRGDDGAGALAQAFGGSYRRVLAGTDPAIPKDFRLPSRFRIDVDRASDDQLVDAAARLVAAYLASLEFERISPYDAFLAKNHLPDEPHEGEPLREYLRRFRLLLAAVEAPEFVESGTDGEFALHRQEFTFGPLELAGLRVFLDRRRGNCVACHPPPDFTDFGLHDTGVSQLDYDRLHGAGAFAALGVPGAAERAAAPETWLPASPAHPSAREPFRGVARADRPGVTDLGAWNLVANADLADRRLQRRLARLVCASRGIQAGCRGFARRTDELLAASVALFKTPGLRDLGHSAPYLHTGGADTIEAAVRHYVDASALARAGQLRNGAPELAAIQLSNDDVTALAAFLRSLNEDYE